MEVLKNYKRTSKIVYLDFGSKKIKISNETFIDLDLTIGEQYNIDNILNEEKIFNTYLDSIKKLTKQLVSEHDFLKNLMLKNELDYDSCLIVVDKLKDNHYLDDTAFVNYSIHKLEKQNFGKSYIIGFLRNRGIKEDYIECLEFPIDREYLKATNYFEVIKRKYLSKNFYKQKSKIYSELYKRGFETNIIKSLLYGMKIDEINEFNNLNNDLLKIKQKFGLFSVLNEVNEGKIISELSKLGYSYRNIIQAIGEGEVNDQ